MYVLICLCLALSGVAGLQFTYMFYLENMDKERKKHLHQLEIECRHLRNDLREAERRIGAQDEQIASITTETDVEAWADVIEDR